MTTQQPLQGVMWVNSGVIKPDQLSEEDFNDWYCDEHIPDVVATSGVDSAARYKRVDGAITSSLHKFLTVYEMPDINFKGSDEFQSLEGQSLGPSTDRIFLKTEFDTRFFEEMKVPGQEGGKVGSAPLVLCETMSHNDDGAFKDWFLKSRVPSMRKISGYLQTRFFKTKSRSKLTEYKRIPLEATTWMALHEFEGAEIPWAEIEKIDANEEARSVLSGVTEREKGGFKVIKSWDTKGK
ncbi:hypothetical protein AJ80_03647 [Polytolypa hystricis UAMH7299]|uniref:EthD domain-containing protein n=1 Tax=Polytolypa hystricis (strain UAMH7299) TaxID=1447883 RepID=A0A2B7YH32_POLH7|nr:hypothetical protein AJ80_03647 [Polytolypa hystricis UAMH7299]